MKQQHTNTSACGLRGIDWFATQWRFFSRERITLHLPGACTAWCKQMPSLPAAAAAAATGQLDQHAHGHKQVFSMRSGAATGTTNGLHKYIHLLPGTFCRLNTS
eukprot:1138008-Pelagomonas_calceolata.AAC.5